MRWTLTDAKNRLSEVLDRALEGEAQTITRRGHEFVLIEATRYRRAAGDDPSLIDHLIDAGPRIDAGFEPRMRDTTPTRDPFADDKDQAVA